MNNPQTPSPPDPDGHGVIEGLNWTNLRMQTKVHIREHQHLPDAVKTPALELTGKAIDIASHVVGNLELVYRCGYDAGYKAAAPETAAERDRLIEEIEQCHAKATCCCGDYMKDHSTYSGHSAVSMYDHSLFEAHEEIDRLKESNKELAKEAPK